MGSPYNIPLFAMTKNIVTMTGGNIGECIEVVSNGDCRCWGYLCKSPDQVENFTAFEKTCESKVGLRGWGGFKVC